MYISPVQPECSSCNKFPGTLSRIESSLGMNPNDHDGDEPEFCRRALEWAAEAQLDGNLKLLQKFTSRRRRRAIGKSVGQTLATEPITGMSISSPVG